MTTEAEVFYAGAERRIPRFMVAAFVLSAGALWYWLGTRFLSGFFIGSVVAFVNLLWLKQIVAAFVEPVSQPGAKGSGWGIALRFLLRYALIAVFAYGMLTNSAVSMNGFSVGLFLPVGALVCEAVYETYVALRRGL